MSQIFFFSNQCALHYKATLLWFLFKFGPLSVGFYSVLYWKVYIWKFSCNNHVTISFQSNFYTINDKYRQFLNQIFCTQINVRTSSKQPLQCRATKLLSKKKHHLAVFCISLHWQRSTRPEKKKDCYLKKRAI